mmetsp:Transcript_591/g.693  ORF Transcript_591/g.693 Transcript_591/m.693 type:complete len:216 (-) Transcript_591:105-752(-)
MSSPSSSSSLSVPPLPPLLSDSLSEEDDTLSSSFPSPSFTVLQARSTCNLSQTRLKKVFFQLPLSSAFCKTLRCKRYASDALMESGHRLQVATCACREFAVLSVRFFAETGKYLPKLFLVMQCLQERPGNPITRSRPRAPGPPRRSLFLKRHGFTWRNSRVTWSVHRPRSSERTSEVLLDDELPAPTFSLSRSSAGLGCNGSRRKVMPQLTSPDS